ncbi:GNAT family N-acetyltransferase [Pseudophaeobacter arcticus]|uniref:GNAT family N-acetyltransferase n=1 Tax=Pseudophaeobacter arcticus TaxID=385492 RepID=UPI003A970B5D
MTIEIRPVTAAELHSLTDALTEILWACVQAGASVSFVLPFSHPDAARFWSDQIFPAVQRGDIILFGAFVDGQLQGTAQLAVAQPPNQQHRADVAKLLVHPKARRGGLGRALMQALETEARHHGKTLLVLDTRSGDPSQRLYESLGYQVAGAIPGYCRNPSADVFEATTYLYKVLAPAALAP